MKARYRLIRRGLRGGVFYCVDKAPGQRHSLGTRQPEEAAQILHAKNQAQRQPVLNLQIAKAYLAGADANFVRRNWAEVMAEFVKTKTGSNRTRSERAVADRAFGPIRELQLLDTRAEHFLRVLENGTLPMNLRFHRAKPCSVRNIVLATDGSWPVSRSERNRKLPRTGGSQFRLQAASAARTG
jgi:hypothetical protein